MNTPKTDIKQSKGQKRFANLSLDPQQFSRPDRPPVQPAAAPPANPMDLPPIPDAPPAIIQVQVDQEEGNPQNPQNEPDPDFNQGNQAHQVPSHTLCRMIIIFQEKQCWFIVSRGISDQQYACLKKVPLYHISSSFFVLE